MLSQLATTRLTLPFVFSSTGFSAVGVRMWGRLWEAFYGLSERSSRGAAETSPRDDGRRLATSLEHRRKIASLRAGREGASPLRGFQPCRWVRRRERLKCARRDQPELRHGRPDHLGDMRRNKVSVMPFDHPRVGMPEIGGNDRQWRTGPQQVRGIGATHNVEAGRRLDLGAPASLAQRPLSSRVKTSAVPGFPAMCCSKSAMPSSVSTTWRGRPALLARTLTVPASRSKSPARKATISPYRQPVRSAHCTSGRKPGSQALTRCCACAWLR